MWIVMLTFVIEASAVNSGSDLDARAFVAVTCVVGRRTMKPARFIVALIEDDPLVRIPLAQGLDDAGYRVLSAASAAEGLSLIDDPAIDVAVIDVVLPGRINGIGIAREAQRLNPRLKVLLTSGKPLPDGLADVSRFVLKPLRLNDLLQNIHRMIEGQGVIDDRAILIKAERIIDEFGDVSTFYAAMRANDLADHGDRERALVWRRIVTAIERIQSGDASGNATRERSPLEDIADGA
jgi:DNA-binding NarL/FixJ family response regulator